MYRELFDNYVTCTGVQENTEVSRLKEFLYHISRTAYGPSSRADVASLEGHGAVVCDMLAVSVALYLLQSPYHITPLSRPHCYSCTDYITHMKHVNVEVETEGKYTRGQTVVDWGCYDGVNRVRNVYWIDELKSDIYLQMFKNMFV